ncbi:hypothetical protein K438DRAFT_2026571 [Mycena galopus ATCC 62051]|nr:hypothetical protein K438DRAFT_2026571 [Mycena galopus ATCC 62051]
MSTTSDFSLDALIYSETIINQRPAEAFALRTPFLLPIPLPLPLPLPVLYLPVCLPVPHTPQDRCAAARLDGHEHRPHARSARDPAPRPHLPLLGRHGPAIGPSPETLQILLDAAQLLDDPSPPELRGAGAEISAQVQAPYRSGVWRGRPAVEMAVQLSAQAVLGALERAHIARLPMPAHAVRARPETGLPPPLPNADCHPLLHPEAAA